jgi:signal transduction histidine kinase
MATTDATAPDVARAAELAALLPVALLVARDAPPEEMYGVLCERVAGLFAADTSSVIRLKGPERGVVLGVWRVAGVRGMPVNAELDFDARNSALGRMARTRRPARADSYEGSTGELPLLMKASGLRSSLAAPVLVHGELWGALVAATGSAQPFPPGSEERLLPFAELIGQSVANAEARRRLVASADEARRGLERALHEGPQQHLLALSLKLRVAYGQAPPGSDLAHLIEDALTEAAATGTALGDLARSLHPTVLKERGLAAAVQALAARAGVPVALRELPARRFGATAETTAYAVVAEVLAGVDSGEASVVVADRGRRLHVEVCGRIGTTDLRDLSQRVAAIGGRLDVEADAVRARIPVAS